MPNTPNGSEPKRGKAGKAWPEETRATALELMRDEGLTAAHDVTGVPKGTLSGWAKAAGIDLLARSRAVTVSAGRAVQARSTELALDTVSRLGRVLDLELDTLEDLATFEAEAMSLLRDSAEDVIAVVEYAANGGGIVGMTLHHRDLPVTQALAKLKLTREAVVKRDTVGAVGLLVDKLELLRGRATERGELRVLFGIPRPDFAAADRDAIVVPAIEP